MPGLLLKEIPRELHRRLKRRATLNRRSLSREILTILEQALTDSAGPPPLSEIDQLRVTGARPLGQRLLDDARRRDRE